MQLSKSSARVLAQAIRTTCLSYGIYATLALCAFQSFASPIVGGDDVDASDPVNESTVALYVTTAKGGSLCTASLVTRDLAVTAAHCLTDDEGKGVDVSQMRVIFGTDLNDPSTVKRVSRVVGAIFEPSFVKINAPGVDRSDVGIIRFSGGLPAGYAPAVLLPQVMKVSNGDTVLLAGYGIDDAITDTGSGVLRKAEVQIGSVDFAKTEVGMDQTQGRGSCHGDSGGPAFLVRGSTSYLFGITSRGNDDCTLAIYSEINSHLQFFRKSARILRALK